MEKKTLEITIPEGKKPVMTDGDNRCVIEWVPAERTFSAYVSVFADSVHMRFYIDIPKSDPYNWDTMFKYGLLQLIADDLNEVDLDWMDGGQNKCSIYCDYENEPPSFDVAQRCKRPGYVFTQKAVVKAMKIIPAEFIKTF